jgi:plastocyanin
LIALILLLFAVLGSACQLNAGDDDEDAAVAQAIEVEAYDFYFEETSFALETGADVTVDFTNAGESTHSFTVPDLDIEVEAQSAESTEVAFETPEEPGLLDFYCKYHPDDMNGTISIGGADVPLEEDVDDDDVDVEVDTEED